MVGPDQLVGNQDGTDTNSSRDCFIDPASGSAYKRSGCAIVGDSVDVNGDETGGILNKNTGLFAKKMLALDSPSLSDGYSAPCILYGLDSSSAGNPGTIYVKSSNGGLTTAQANYSLLEEFGTTHYKTGPDSGHSSSSYNLKVVPIWVDSGDGVYNRGALTGTATTSSG